MDGNSAGHWPPGLGSEPGRGKHIPHRILPAGSGPHWGQGFRQTGSNRTDPGGRHRLRSSGPLLWAGHPSPAHPPIMPLRTHSSPGSLPRAGVPLDLTALPPLLLVPLPAMLVSLPFFLSCKFPSLPGPRASPRGLKALSPFRSVQSLSRVRLLATPWTAARQASLSITNSQSLLKLTPIKSVMPSNHLILCRPLLLLPSSIRAFPMSGFFTSGGQRIGASASASRGPVAQDKHGGHWSRGHRTPLPWSQSLFPHLASLHPKTTNVSRAVQM